MSACFFFFKQKTAYEMRISDWSSDVCSSDLHPLAILGRDAGAAVGHCEVRSVVDPSEAHADLAAARAVLHRVVEQVGERLAEQLAMAADGDARVDRAGQLQPGLLGDRLVDLQQILSQSRAIERGEGQAVGRSDGGG